MEESALDLDSLSGLIRETLKRMDREELSKIASLLEAGELQKMILGALDLNEESCSPGEIAALTVLLQTALKKIPE